MNTTVSHPYFAGVAQAVITPPAGTELLEPRGVPSTGVHDDLFVRALALDDGETELVVVTMDLLGLDLDLVARIRRTVYDRTGLPADRLMLTTTHTHSAPVTLLACPSAQAKRNRKWEDQLVMQSAETVAEARTARQPATPYSGQADVQIGVNRRLAGLTRATMADNPAGPIAPWVDVLRVDSAAGAPLALLFSHAAHPVTVHDTDSQISADFPGAAVQTVRHHLGQDMVAMFAQGCAGDINVATWRGGFAAAATTGATLGWAAVNAANAASPLAAGDICVVNREVYLPFEVMDLAAAEATLARLREAEQTQLAGAPDFRALDDQGSALARADNMVQLARGEKRLPGLHFQVQGFALGPDLALVALSNEPFVEYQRFVQAHSPFRHTLVFGYTNGCTGYLPTADAYYLGGYEAHGAHKLFGLPRLRPESDAIIKATCRAVLDDLQRTYS